MGGGVRPGRSTAQCRFDYTTREANSIFCHVGQKVGGLACTSKLRKRKDATSRRVYNTSAGQRRDYDRRLLRNIDDDWLQYLMTSAISQPRVEARTDDAAVARDRT